MKVHTSQEPVQTAYPASTIEIADSGTRRLIGILDQVVQELDAGHLDAAEQHLRGGLRDDPDNPKLQAYLSICVASAGRDLDAAEELARRIIEDHPDQAAGHFALGKVKLQGEKRRFAFAAFARARRLARGDRQMQRELARNEPRQSPVFAAFGRNHWLNIVCGRLRATFRHWTRR